MISLNKIILDIIKKGQDPSSLGRLTFIKLLGKHNSRTTIFTMYRSCNSPVESIGGVTVIKQQRLFIQEQERKVHPHQVTITDTIDSIKKTQKEGHEIIKSLNENKKYLQAKGRIARLCHECKLHDPFTHHHETKCDMKFHSRGRHRIHFIFCTNNLLNAIQLSGMTVFHDVTRSDHCGLYLDMQLQVITSPKDTSTPSSFER